jgi:hypothetical protein
MPRSLLVIVWLLLLVTTTLAASPRILDLAGPDQAALVQEDARRLTVTGGPERFAWPADVALTAADGDGWDRLPGGEHRWRLEVRAPGALSLNFGFSRFRLPWGARLVIRGDRGPDRVYTAADNADHGQLWTPVVLGDRALVTLVLPPGHRDDHALELARVGRGYRLFGEEPAAKQGDCNIDVVCPEGDPWRQEIRSIGVYTLSGQWKCTGAMINNTSEDQTPYFLTANHCGVREFNEASVVVYWNYESPTCGQLSGGSLEDTQTGSVWRASHVPSDMTLLELTAAPDTSWHVTWAGWDRRDRPVAAAVTIHHPSTDEKAISFEDDPLRVTSYLATDEPGNGTHWRVVDWDLGTTEPGSSGAPLFTPERRIIGQLHGGYAACGNDLSDWYGRLTVAWTGDGTDDTQLAAWLDPTGTGVTTLDLFDPNDPDMPPPDPTPEALALQGAVPNPTVSGVPTLVVEMPADGTARLRVYDLRGRLVGTVYDGPLEAGVHQLPWLNARVASGVYVARLETLGQVQHQAFTLLR